MLPSLSSTRPCGPVCGVLSGYSLIAPVLGSRRPSLPDSCPVYQIAPSLVASGSCGREPGVGTGQSSIFASTGPGMTTAAGRGRSGKFLMRYWVSVSTSSLGMGTSKLSIMRMTVCQPSGVYPARARLMSWQAPHKLTNVCLPGPSAKSACACCAYAGAVVQKRVAAIAAKSGCLDMLPSPQTLLCASLPQFLGCKPRTLREGGELHPHDLGVDLQPAGKGAEAAIDAGD